MKEQTLFRRFVMLTTAFITLALAGTALAQMGQQRGALEQEFLQLQERLTHAQRQALENNPSLQEQADAIEDLVTEKMREAGYDPGGSMETLLAAEGRLQDETLTDAERREILESDEVRDAQRQMQEAQRAVMQDPELVNAHRGLEQDMLEAMRKEDPETDRMIRRVREIQQEMQGSMR